MNEHLRSEAEKAKLDLLNEIDKNEEMKKDLWHNIDLRQRSETALKEMAEEVDNYKNKSEDTKSHDS